MSRLFLCFAAIVLIVEWVSAQPPIAGPRMQVVVAEGDKLMLDEQVVVTRAVPRTEERVINGQKVTVTVLMSVPEYVTKRSAVKLKDVSVHDLAGAKIDPDRVPEMLKKPTAVIVSPTGEIDKKFRDILKDGTLIVVLPFSSPDKPKDKPIPGPDQKQK